MKELARNQTFHAADRTTHRKIVVLAAVAGIAVTIGGLHGRSVSGINSLRPKTTVHLSLAPDDLNPVAVADLR